ncbi:hypothetical protein AB6A40_000553 [Gnathostoma spinigerum]|uniref:Uncharacterized protein n=1 Tax=Gnathostoma spinigerum TaxID=75299 RepID=A0ABD6E2C2_9BILA
MIYNGETTSPTNPDQIFTNEMATNRDSTKVSFFRIFEAMMSARFLSFFFCCSTPSNRIIRVEHRNVLVLAHVDKWTANHEVDRECMSGSRIHKWTSRNSATLTSKYWPNFRSYVW